MTIDKTKRAIATLGDDYDEAGALKLLKALGDCDAFVSPALSSLHTFEQEAARRGYHQICATLSNAIRRAIAYPGRPRHEHTVVILVQELQRAIEAMRSSFGWYCGESLGRGDHAGDGPSHD